MSRPNILYIHSHDTGRYVSPYGHPFRTPNIQRFAEQGVLFRQAFCANPTCSPSRAALLTGCYPHQNGMLGLAHRGFSLKDYGQHILHTLRPAGYRSVLCGIQHIAGKAAGGAEVIGYDQRLEFNGWPEVSVEAAKWLRDEGPSQPFFMSVGFIETHRGFPRHDPADDPRFMPVPAPLPNTPETRRDMADYATMAHQLDDQVGRVLGALRDAGLADNTLVILTTDHGIAFPQMKCQLTDHGIGVMLMMRGPAGSPFSGGKCIDAMVSHLDLYPTMCEVAGVEKPDWLEGASLLPLIRGEVDELHDTIYATVNYHAAYEPQRCVRTRRYKYIRRLDDYATPVLANCDASACKDLLLAHGWKDRPVPGEQLFDLLYDPNESHNLIDDPAARDVLADMRQRLDAWMQRTDDPGLHGPIAAPVGAEINEQDQLDPNEPPTQIA